VKLIVAASLFLMLLGTLFPFGSAWGAIDFSDAAYPEFATSGRALALGNAYIAKVDDSASAFYNPAGLGTVRKPHFHLSNIHLEANKDWIDLGTGGSVTSAGSNFMKGFKVDGTRDLLKDHPGSFSHSRFHFMPNFTARFISIGYLHSSQTRGAFGSQDGAQFEYAKRTDTGPYASLNVSLFGGILKFGATGIYLTRKEAFGESDPNTTLDLQNEDFKKGRSFLVTFGSKFTIPVYGLPTFAVKMNNATSKEFNGSEGYGGAPDKVKPSIDVGFSITPQIGKTTRIHWEVNYKDATKKFGDVSSARRWGLGLELDFRRIFFIRFGYGDGFGSGGLGIRTRKLEFDLTTYAVDTTNSSFRGEEDRRFLVNISSGF
jgi:hypothetical protein